MLQLDLSTVSYKRSTEDTCKVVLFIADMHERYKDMVYLLLIFQSNIVASVAK